MFSQFKKRAPIGFNLVAEKMFPKRDAEVEILFCRDSFIQKINKEHRKKDKPTDVLSFPTDFLKDPFTPTLGDIVISIDTAKKQAKEYGVSLLDELMRLYHHGLLHLLGFDHEKVSASKRAQMKRWEKKLWDKVN